MIFFKNEWKTKTWIEGYIFNQKVVYDTQIKKKKA